MLKEQLWAEEMAKQRARNGALCLAFLYVGADRYNGLERKCPESCAPNMRGFFIEGTPSAYCKGLGVMEVDKAGGIYRLFYIF